MNNKGSSIFLIVLIAVVYFMAGMIMYQLIKPDIDLARTGLSCSSPTTAGDRFDCLVIDGIVPIVVITILSATGGFITEKVI